MPKAIDLTGKRFGKVSVLKEAPKIKIKRRWLVKCDCGKTYDLDGDTLRTVRACSSCAKTTHGQSHGGPNKREGSKEYRVWTSLFGRCRNPNHQNYPSYGGRGIKIVPPMDVFEEFIKHVGPIPSSEHTIDRINNDGNYEKGNIRWALRDCQIWNQRKRRNTRHRYKGVSFEDGAFRARLYSGEKIFDLGRFKTSGEAAKAWDKKALEIRGKDARLNFPER